MEPQTKPVTIGAVLASTYFEGYLTHVIPSDGYRFVGFEENIIAFEGTQSVRFPVRRLFIVVTKTMYCPPDLKLLDPQMESCKSLGEVQKDVAGVKNRSYKNSVYRINRTGARPVHLAVECATPLHTLSLVMNNGTLYPDTDPSQTLSEVLLERIRQIEPTFEEMI